MRSKVFFTGLNELRAFAALAVLFHHIELYKHRLSIGSLYDTTIVTFIDGLGKNGVYLFFVLSGFLITYLLLEEKSINGNISISKFYGRRILRIWPLYFIIVIIGFLLLPIVYQWFPTFFDGQENFNERIKNIVYEKNLLLFLLFFSNVALRIYGPVAGAAQSWSVSVEEQFYFIWPWIVKLFSRILLGVLICIIIAVTTVQYEIAKFADYPLLKAFLSTFTIDFMAMGGIVAVIYRKKRDWLQKFILNKIVIVCLLLSLVAHLLVKLPNFTLALTFGLLILWVIESGFKIKCFDALGKWSYGIYMYHPVMMYFSFAIITQLHVESFIATNVMAYVLIVGLTILTSYLSYRYIELFFLKVKHKYSPIVSGNI